MKGHAKRLLETRKNHKQRTYAMFFFHFCKLCAKQARYNEHTVWKYLSIDRQHFN